MACVLVVLNMEGGVLVGGESVRSEIFVDFKKSEHQDKIDLSIFLNFYYWYFYMYCVILFIYFFES